MPSTFMAFLLALALAGAWRCQGKPEAAASAAPAQVGADAAKQVEAAT
jgi:hypothetical protein